MSLVVDVAIAFIEPLLEALGVDSKRTPCATKRQIWTVVITVVTITVAVYVGVRWYK